MNVKLDERYDLYINGTWVPASDGRVFTTTNPATGEKLAECAEATKEDVVPLFRPPGLPSPLGETWSLTSAPISC